MKKITLTKKELIFITIITSISSILWMVAEIKILDTGNMQYLILGIPSLIIAIGCYYVIIMRLLKWMSKKYYRS